MNLILLRHGETDGNREKRYIGRTDLPLNERGRAQAAMAAERLREEELAAIYHSPLLRCVQTAEIVAAGRGLPLFAEERLMELDFGCWDGLTYEEIERLDRDRLWAWHDDPWRVSPPGGETLALLAARVESFVKEIGRKHDGSTVLLVAHGGPLRWLIDPAAFQSVRLAPGEVHVRNR